MSFEHLLTPLIMMRAIAAFLLVMLPFVALAGANESFASERGDEEVGQQVCDPTADYFLGVEDYSKAIRLHQKVLLTDPKNALAHYHLGFAYGMVGRGGEELREYQRAIDLRLTNWDLFLNLGLLYLKQGDLNGATNAFVVAALRAPYKPETHFNLAVVYERRGMLRLAERETLISLELDSNQPDAGEHSWRDLR